MDESFGPGPGVGGRGDAFRHDRRGGVFRAGHGRHAVASNSTCTAKCRPTARSACEWPSRGSGRCTSTTSRSSRTSARRRTCCRRRSRRARRWAGSSRAVHQQDDPARHRRRPSSATAASLPGRTTSTMTGGRRSSGSSRATGCPAGCRPRRACSPSRSAAGTWRSSRWPAGGSGSSSCRGPCTTRSRTRSRLPTAFRRGGTARSNRSNGPPSPCAKRTVAQLDATFKHGDGPLLLGACQTLVDSGKVSFVRDTPQPGPVPRPLEPVAGQHPSDDLAGHVRLLVRPRVRPRGAADPAGRRACRVPDRGPGRATTPRAGTSGSCRRRSRPATSGLWTTCWPDGTSAETLRLATWMVLGAAVLAVAARLLMR